MGKTSYGLEVEQMFKRCGLDPDRQPNRSVRRSGTTTATMMHLLVALENGDDVTWVDHEPARGGHLCMLRQYAKAAGIDISGVKCVSNEAYSREAKRNARAYENTTIFFDHYDERYYR